MATPDGRIPFLCIPIWMIRRGISVKKINTWLARSWKRRFCGLALGVLTVAIPNHLFAALGENVSSVQSDQVHMQASVRTIQSNTHVVHELHSPTGTVVREYVSSGGTVFAVAWEGPWLPDMRQLLGSHFDEYVRAVQAQSNGRVGRRPIEIELPGLVVRMTGHPRSYTGHAFVPEMMPQGVKAEDIR